MIKRVFIIHGWGGHPGEGWFPWLKKELETKGFGVFVPQMLDTDNPLIQNWVPALAAVVGSPDQDTYFVGHSVGCQTILRYLEKLQEDKKIGGCIFVGSWINLKEEAYEEEKDREIAKPWLETPINWNKIIKHTNKFVNIFSDDDPYVFVEDSKIFEEKLNSKIVVEKNKGHFTEYDNVKELPIVLKEIIELTK